MKDLFAEVALPVPLRKTFTYGIPTELQERVNRGSPVTVPFGRRRLSGFVIRLADSTAVSPVKAVLAVGGELEALPPEVLRLSEWVSEYYLAPLGEVLRAACPVGSSRRARKSAADALLDGAEPGGDGGGRPAAASKRGNDTARAGDAKRGEEAKRPALTRAQEAALEPVFEALQARVYRSFLLLGVTGSGKTEVYLRAAEAALEASGSVLVLLPEISLAPQILSRFRERFGERVVVLHSALARGERRRAWERLRSGEARIVIGARSAVFAPLRDLRLVVVDEEHEPAYKQDDAPRYHGRDVAIMRGRLENAAVLLGSATPSLESRWNAEQGKSTLLTLPARIGNRPVARVELVRMTKPAEGEASRILSPLLLEKIGARLEAREQIILFLNRRGYSTFVQCRECGEAARCPHCAVSLTWHEADRELKCHYCGHRRRDLAACGGCGGALFVMKGAGTQRVEAEITRLFPEARMIRMDVDSTRRRGSHASYLAAFEAGEVDILLGTQMVAKGLDYPSVTLVGVVNADTQLNLPDFRAAERTFQLLTQVAGRAGRGERAGEVVIQTQSAEHYALVAASKQDYGAFYEREMAERRELSYPPYTRLLNVLLDGKDEARVIEAADQVRRLLERAGRERQGRGRAGAHTPAEANGRTGGDGAGSDPEILGPAPQPLSRLRGQHRWHLTLKSADHRSLAERGEILLREAVPALPAGVRLALDVDPVHLL